MLYWLISYIPPTVRKPINTHVEALKKKVNNIYNRVKINKESNKLETKTVIYKEGNNLELKDTIKQRKSALNGFLKSYRIEGNDKQDPKVFLNSNMNKTIEKIKKQPKPVKMKFLLCEFYEMNKKGSVEKKNVRIYSYGYFHTKIEIVTQATDLEVVYKIGTERILEKVGNYQNNGSGWIFNKVDHFDIHIDKYKPIAAKSYISLPQKLKVKKAIVNPQNKDNQCFKWAITTCLFTPQKNVERITNVLKANAEKLNWDGLVYPAQVDKISIFEMNNPKYGIKVYKYENENVYPLRITE